MNTNIFYNIDDYNDGCGFIVGNLFITAAHVISERPFILRIDDKIVNLKKEEAILYEYKQEKYGADVAVFTIDGYNSPLVLDEEEPHKGMCLESIYYEHVVERKENESIWGKSVNERQEEKKCEAVVTELYGNFFQCETSEILKSGSSGSPAFYQGKVIGILHGGHPGMNICVYNSSASIIKMLRKTLQF